MIIYFSSPSDLLGIGEDVFSIGANAMVKLVNIGDIQGEFVVGGWKAVSTQPCFGNTNSHQSDQYQGNLGQ